MGGRGGPAAGEEYCGTDGGRSGDVLARGVCLHKQRPVLFGNMCRRLHAPVGGTAGHGLPKYHLRGDLILNCPVNSCSSQTVVGQLRRGFDDAYKLVSRIGQ
jgi:hypothetical protein